MARRIKYPTRCYRCGELFQPGKAFLHRVAGKWLCHCDACYEAKKRSEAKEEPTDAE